MVVMLKFIKGGTCMLYLGIISSVFILDFFIKKYFEEKKELYKEEKILKGKLILRKYHNKGVMLNFLENKQPVVLMMSFLAILALAVYFGLTVVKKGSELLKLGLSFMLGGALSNFYDRVTRKYVVDYFSFNSKWNRIRKVIFNLSDISIFLGGVLIIIASIFGRRK